MQSTPEKTRQITEVKLPKWVDKASLENYKLARKIGNKDYKAYDGNTVADLDPSTRRAFKYLNTSAANTAANYAKVNSIFDQVANTQITPGTVTAGQLKDTDLTPYMNPYIDNVETKAIGALNDQRIQSLMGNADRAAAAGAFGGSRAGIVDAVTNSETAKSAGLLSAQLRSDAFNNAQSAASQDVAGKYAADVSNRDADYNAQLANLDALTGAGQGLLSSASAENDAALRNYAGMFQNSQLLTSQKQKKLDAKYSKWQDRQNYPTDMLNLRLSALGMSPYGKTETTDKTVTPASSGTDWAQAGLGVFSLLLGLSEDDTKTDKEKVGKLPGTDLDIWAYRYKKDPKDRPKVVGLMASDIQEKMPEAVIDIGGKRIVDYTKILESL